nr:unnamed protein product [Naegleria fowleri]
MIISSSSIQRLVAFTFLLSFVAVWHYSSSTLVFASPSPKLQLFKQHLRLSSSFSSTSNTNLSPSTVENGVWTNVFQLFGIRSPNNQTDTDNNPKFISLFYDGLHQLMRIDAAGLGGPNALLSSTTVVFETLRFYMNVVSVDFCIFEHLHPNNTNWYGARIFPFSQKKTQREGGFVISNYKMASLVKRGIVIDQSKLIVGMNSQRECDLYKLDAHSDLAVGFGFYLFNYQGPQFVDVYYYEDLKTKQPARFEIYGLNGYKEVTTFDVVNFEFYGEGDDSENVFQKDMFYWNVKPTCH